MGSFCAGACCGMVWGALAWFGVLWREGGRQVKRVGREGAQGAEKWDEGRGAEGSGQGVGELWLRILGLL